MLCGSGAGWVAVVAELHLDVVEGSVVSGSGAASHCGSRAVWRGGSGAARHTGSGAVDPRGIDHTNAPKCPLIREELIAEMPRACLINGGIDHTNVFCVCFGQRGAAKAFPPYIPVRHHN